MTSSDDLDRLKTLAEMALVEEIGVFFRKQDGGYLSDRELFVAAMTGFDDDEAEAVLQDDDALARLNSFWNAFSDDALPRSFQDRIDEERAHGGDQWNLRVAHRAGRAWADDPDLDDDWAGTAQQLGALAMKEEILLTARSRGSRSEAPWETYFRSQHFLILLRAEGGQLVIEALSESSSGLFELSLRWADGTSSTHQVRIRAGEASRLGFEPPSAGLPVSAAIRVAAPRPEEEEPVALSSLFSLTLAEQQDFTLAAASREDHRPAVAELPSGERLVAQPLSDRQTFLRLSLPRDRAAADRIVRAEVGAGGTATVVLLILVEEEEGWVSEYLLDTDRPTIPRVALTSGSTLGIDELSEEDLAALSRSVAGASLRCKDAWLRVARPLARSHPLHAAIREAFE